MLNRLKVPELSVVIPVFRRRGLSVQAIRSVLEQESVGSDRTEIVIVDDEDGAMQAKQNRKFYTLLAPNIRYLRNEFEEGPGGARQTGLRAARGKYLTFLDSDDYLKPRFASRMLKVLKSDESLVGAVAYSYPIFDKGFPFNERMKLIPLILIRDVILVISFIFNNRRLFPGSFYLCQVSHMIFRRSLIKELRFNYDYRRGGEDWDFFVQALGVGDIRILPEKLLVFRYSKGSSTDTSVNRKRKWSSYKKLADSLHGKLKSGIFYRLMLIYIYIFGGRYEKS